MKNLFNIILVIAISLVLTGCVLTDMAKDYFVQAVDLNQYEEAKDIDNKICEPEILSRLQKTRSKKWYDETVADCRKRKEESVPLLN